MTKLKKINLERFKNLNWHLFFVLLYVLPLFIFERQIIGLYPDEYRAIELANKYWDELLGAGEFYLYGMNYYTGSFVYYILGLFLKMLGESLLTLRFFAVLLTYLNLNLLKKVISYRKSHSVHLVLMAFMSLSAIILYGRMTLEVSTVLPFFILLGICFYQSEKWVLAGLFMGLAIVTHPVSIPFILFLICWKWDQTKMRQWIFALLGLSSVILIRVPHYLQAMGDKRASHLYFSLGKFIDIPLNLIDFLNSGKIILTSVGFINYFSVPVFVIAFFAFLIKKQKELHWKSLSKKVLVGAGIYWVSSFLVLPALNFQYYILAGSLIAISLFMQLDRRILWGIIIINCFQAQWNYFLPYSRTGGVGTFYDHAYADKGIKDRNPYHSYYFVDIEPELKALAEGKVEVVFTNDYFLINILKFYSLQWKQFQVATVDHYNFFPDIEESKIAFVSYSYHKVPNKIKVGERILFRTSLSNKKINIFVSKN